MTARELVFDGFRARAEAGFAVADPVAEARRLLDPGCALATLHWGRNYLYRARVETTTGPLDVVVKQFREHGLRDRLRRWSGRPGRAAKSWDVARALVEAGLPTAAPLLLVEPVARGRGPSLFVCRWLADRTELRYLLRARNAGREAEQFPAVDFGALLAAVARLARALHEARIWFRDFSVGNLLVRVEEGGDCDIALVDLNRCRLGASVTLSERMRDLCRLPLERAGDRRALLAAYFGDEPVPARARFGYELARRSFHGRHRVKPKLRAAWAKLRSWLVPRGVHAHIPEAPAGASARDKIVWDALSDQPHSHASRLERARVRVADLPDHLRTFGALLAAVPRIRRRSRELTAGRGREPFAWPGAGVALRPWPADPAALLAAFDELGVRQGLIRLHPWQERHDAEEELARALAARGVELTFSLPQVRELVRDPGRWRAAVAELAERFVPFGRRFQIGQAINRSKWGVWSYGEYLALAESAAEVLRRYPGVELAGPAVIDFEAHVAAGVLNRRAEFRFDALASLLYVDRRGAPENRQLGYDAADKATLLTAIAATARRLGAPRQWITEVNWPLAEGPHSPAGRSVAVDEATQADYLVRFYLATLGTGLVERVYWWQLVARGYGLVDPTGDGRLRRRPAHAALATLERELAGSVCLGARPAPAPVRQWAFRRGDGGETHVVWSTGGPVALSLERTPESVAGRDGGAVTLGAREVAVGGSPLYLRWAPADATGTARA